MPHGTTIKTNGQTLKVNASVSYWTTEALALTASGTNDVESTTTTTITADTTLWFANTATTATITVTQMDGTTLHTGTYQVNPGVGARYIDIVPDRYQQASDIDTVRRAGTQTAAALVEIIPRIMATSNIGVLSSGRLSMQGIHLPKGLLVSNISFQSATTAAGTPTNQMFGLYDSSRVLLATSADDTTTAWGANTLKTLAMTTPYTTTYSGLHYLGIMVAASTVPTFQGSVGLSALNGLTPVLCGSADTGLTTALPATAASLSATPTLVYGYVS